MTNGATLSIILRFVIGMTTTQVAWGSEATKLVRATGGCLGRGRR